MSSESYYKQIVEGLNKDILGVKEKYPEMKSNCYPQELVKMFEKYIEVYGHAYCMDLGSERKKISKLLYKFLNDLKYWG